MYLPKRGYKGKILIFLGFVGGYGGLSKGKRTASSLEERGYGVSIATVENSYRDKLKLFGVEPDITIPIIGNTIDDKYASVEKALSKIDYDTIVSFTPRTYPMIDAINKGKKSIIVDGGPPDRIDDERTEYWGDVYRSLNNFILTSHFDFDPYSICDERGINMSVRFQPVDERLSRMLAQYRNLDPGEKNLEKRKIFNRIFNSNVNADVYMSLLMGGSYIDPKSLRTNGGFLEDREYAQCTSFVENFFRSLDDSGKKVAVSSDKRIADYLKTKKFNFKNVRVLNKSFIDPDDSVELCALTDLTVGRAMRCVSEAQMAAAGGHGLVSIVPVDYMKEDVSADLAVGRGLTYWIPYDNPDSGKDALNYISSEGYHKSRELRLAESDVMMNTKNITDEIIKTHCK